MLVATDENPKILRDYEEIQEAIPIVKKAAKKAAKSFDFGKNPKRSK